MVGEMFEVVERGEMMTRELLMLEDILVLEVAMRLLAWDCNKMNHAFRFRLGNFPDTTRDLHLVLGLDWTDGKLAQFARQDQSQLKPTN